MARTRNRRRTTSQTERFKARKNALHDIETLAILLLADADCEDDEIAALGIVEIALNEGRNIQTMRSGRYGRRGLYNQEKGTQFYEMLLNQFPDRWFKSWLRMDRISFWKLVDLIKDDPIFISTGPKPQRPVAHQLATFLCRVGAETSVKSAGVMAISEGSVYDYMRRVVKALRRLRPQFLRWPTPAERDADAEIMEENGTFFPGQLGSGDGSYIHLQEKPKVNPFAYWCHKKFYVLTIQATVNNKSQFTSYDLGWPGSVQDSRVFRNSDLWRNRNEFFRNHEYILVDKGYPLTPFSIRPFNDHDLTGNPIEASNRKRWNQAPPPIRIAVEHAFGRLKGRFPILQFLPGQNLKSIYHLIEALMIVHNILEGFMDDPTLIRDFNGQDDDDDVEGVMGQAPVEMAEYDANSLYRQGVLRRKNLLAYFLTN